MDATTPPRPDPAAPPRVLVLGGAGFIGRHAVTALLSRGAHTEIGSRHPGRIARRLPAEALACARRTVHFEDLLHPEDWTPMLEHVA